MSRKLVLFIATSLDGYIATPEGNLDFLNLVTEEDQDYGYQDFIASVDTVILGRKTYDKVLSFGIEFPHADKTTFVITRQSRPGTDQLHFYTGDLETLVQELKAKPGKNIFCDGGAEVIAALLGHRLVDEITVSVIPVLLGSGIRLFTDALPQQSLRLVNCRHFPKGLVQVKYELLTQTPSTAPHK